MLKIVVVDAPPAGGEGLSVGGPDQAAIDAVIAAFYAAFDNRDGRAPATSALRGLFTPEARVVRVSAEGVASWDLEAFIAPREAMLGDGTLLDFHEWETDAATQVSGNIASRTSRYRKAGTLNGAPYVGEGRKFIQLARGADARWRITAVLWEDD